MGSYDPQVETDQLEGREKLLQHELTLCRRVKQTLDTRGWKEIVEPLIDKLIIDVLGSKVNGRWCPGTVDRARKDERREFHIGYKSGLVKLHNILYATYIDQIKVKEEELKNIDAMKRKGTKIPVVDDSKYAPPKEEI